MHPNTHFFLLHYLASMCNRPTKHLKYALFTKTDTENGDLTGKMSYHITRHSSIPWMTRSYEIEGVPLTTLLKPPPLPRITRRDDNVPGVHPLHIIHRDLIISEHLDIRTKLRQVLDHVPREAIIVVNH